MPDRKSGRAAGVPPTRGFDMQPAQDRKVPPPSSAAVLDSIVDLAVVCLDADFRITLFSKGAEMLFGHSIEWTGGRPFSLLFRRDDPVVAEIRAKAEAAGHYHGELSLLRNKGVTFLGELDLRRLPAPTGGSAAYVIVINDLTERTIRDSEYAAFSGLHEAIVQSADFGILTTDDELQVRSWNLLLEHYTGKPAAHVVGRPVVEVMAALDAAGWTRRMRRVLQMGEPDVSFGQRALVSPRRASSGETILQNVKLVPLRGDRGQIIGVLAMLEDVTERTRLEERYQYLFENAHDAIFTLDGEGRFQTINKTGRLRSGYTPKDLEARFFTDIVAPESLKVAAAAFDRILQKGNVTFQCDVLARDGRRMTLEVAATTLREGHRPTILGIARDVTLRKRVEERVVGLMEMNEAILATIPLAILVVDADLRVILVNERYYAIFESATEDVHGKEVLGIPPFTIAPDEAMEAVVESLRTGGEARVVIPAGRGRRSLEVTLHPVRRSGDARALIVIAEMPAPESRATS